MMRSTARVRGVRACCALLVFTLIVGACSGDDASSATGSRAVADDPLFSVLINEGRQVLGTADGFTLYIFDGDARNVSACLDTCAKTFIPVAAPTETHPAGNGIDDGLIGSFDRPDGITQLSFGGRALYRFSADSNPGDSAGEGSAGRWHLISPKGLRVPRVS